MPANGDHPAAVKPESLRLEPGAHDSPEDGVCVMEMASLIAGEKFSDDPECVCEVIAAFMRSWNDRLSHADRQRLVPYAKRVIGTRADKATTRRRRDACLTWAGADLGGGRAARLRALLAMRVRVAVLIGIRPSIRLAEGAGEYAARLAFGRHDAATAYGLLDSLLEIREGEERRRAASPLPRPGDYAGAPAEREQVKIWILARMRLRGSDGAITPGTPIRPSTKAGAKS